MKMTFLVVRCTSIILWAFLCRRHAYFWPTKCDMVNDHVVHQLLLKKVFRADDFQKYQGRGLCHFPYSNRVAPPESRSKPALSPLLYTYQNGGGMQKEDRLFKIIWFASCVCMYVCVCVCVWCAHPECVCVHVTLCACVHQCKLVVCVCSYVHEYVSLTHISVCMCTCAQTSCKCVCVCVCTAMYVCMSVCVQRCQILYPSRNKSSAYMAFHVISMFFFKHYLPCSVIPRLLKKTAGLFYPLYMHAL